jgi:hypothetical protein
VALAGDHAQAERDSWRDIASQVYDYLLAAIAGLIIFLFPPRVDLHWATLLQVAILMAFVVLMERPTRTTAVEIVAPMVAVTTAAVIIFGYWTILIVVAAWLTVRYHMGGPDNRLKYLLMPETVGQLGIAVLTVYACALVWHGVAVGISHAPVLARSALTLIGILAVGLCCQTTNNLLAYPWYRIMGRPFSMSQMLRTGVIAAVYGYLLVAMYRFGGLLAATVFYIIVAQIRMTQDILGVTTQLHKLEKSQQQAVGILRDMMRLTDADNVEFTREVQNISHMLGRRLGMSSKDLGLLDLAAELHQMGKAKLPARIRIGLSLNPKEEAQRQTYTRWGGLMIRATDALLPQQIADWIEFHGEHYDGSGYPRGLKGDAIPLPSRILTVARDYVRFLTGYDGAPTLEKEKALALLREGSGTLYDPRIVNLLIDLVS